MKRTTVLILEESELRTDIGAKNFEDIVSSDFFVHSKVFQYEELVLYIDQHGQTKVLKNRFGKQGIVKNI